MLSYDAGVFVVCLVVAQATVGAVELLRDRGWMPTQLARKIMHISEGRFTNAEASLSQPAVLSDPPLPHYQVAGWRCVQQSACGTHAALL
jgi:hypothetical protein